MSKLTGSEAAQLHALSILAESLGCDIQTDDRGQIVIYTRVFCAIDGSENNKSPDPSWEDG